MRIFMTGGTGFLGRVVIDRLLLENHSIVALTRKANAFGSTSVEEVVGQLDNIAGWQAKMKDCDVVVHCAAPMEFWGPWQKFFNEITLATRNILEAAERQNVKRFIYISSESVLQSKHDLTDIDESYPYPAEPNSFYGKSKMLAEQEILRFNGKTETIILRPTFIYGKGVKAVETMKEAIEKGKFTWIDKGEITFEMVYVENVAEAVYKALTNGKNKGIYNVTDHSPQKIKYFLTELLTAHHVAVPDKSMPSFVAKPVAGLVEWIWKFFHLKGIPPITRFDLSFVAMNRSYKTDKAKNELKYNPVYTTKQALEKIKEQ